MCFWVVLFLLFCRGSVVVLSGVQQRHVHAPLLDQLSSLSAKSHHSTGPIVLATVECYTHSSALLRNLLFSVARFTSAKHPVRFYIAHTYDQSLLSHPQLLLCKHKDKCDVLLHYLWEEKHVDVRFVQVANNSFVNAFRPCSSSHLWLADILPDEDKVIYLDRDMIVLQDLYPLWQLFQVFPMKVAFAMANERNSEHFVALKHVSPYRSGNKDKPGPYYIPPHGLNAGMALYHLQHMRKYRVVRDFEYIINLDMNLPFADQDVINYYAIQQPGRYAVLSCKWNQRANFQTVTDHCNNFHRLATSSENGIVHGSRGIFLQAEMLMELYFTKKKKTEKITSGSRTDSISYVSLPTTISNVSNDENFNFNITSLFLDTIIDQSKPQYKYKMNAKLLMFEYFKNDLLMNNGIKLSNEKNSGYSTNSDSQYWNC